VLELALFPICVEEQAEIANAGTILNSEWSLSWSIVAS